MPAAEALTLPIQPSRTLAPLIHGLHSALARLGSVASVSQTMHTTCQSGVIAVTDGVMTYQSSGYGSWSLPVAAITQVEEYTTPDGPFLDDYFYRLRLSETDERTASIYASGWKEVWPVLNRALQAWSSPVCAIPRSTGIACSGP